MSKRKTIKTALAEMLKASLTGTNGYATDISGNAYPELKYWDEVNDFPCIYMTAGTESREYLPSNQRWGYIPVALKLYVKGESPQELLEPLLDDVETAIENHRNLIIDNTKGLVTTDIEIVSISTDEGHLSPWGVGEILVQVRYPVL